jgi:ABC-2 type transport system ATP-binding protein
MSLNASQPPNMIEVEHLSKLYGPTPAISDLSFGVEKGEVLGFLGPNGAGKTTTMRILTGYLPATSGSARVAGFEVHEHSMAVRQRIGYLPESPPLYPEMSVEGFLHFVARIKGVPGGDRPKRVNSAITRCGLSERRRTLIRKLSKGYRQRVGIAQAIVHDPPVIVLDEPTVGLDPRQITEVRNLIKKLAGDHTVILSTHILPEVSMLCDRITIINKGRTVVTGNPESLKRELLGGGGYEVEFSGDRSRATELLGQLPGVKGIEPLAQDKGLKVLVDDDIGGAIAAALVQGGLNLLEMRRLKANLEDVFLQLTTEEIQSKTVKPAGSEISLPAIARPAVEAESQSAIAAPATVETAPADNQEEQS